MPNHHNLSGVYAAALTPMGDDFSLDLESVPPLMDFLATRGCQGILLLGTTGEGPSIAPNERIDLLRTALQIRQSHPDIRLLAGTGTPSLEVSIALTRACFDLGMDGVVVLPPYYFRNVPDDGLFAWYSELLRRAVPGDGALFGYHIPAVSGVPLSIDLLSRLKDAFPDQFVGIKDSSGDPQHAQLLGARFGRELVILTGNDRLFSLALKRGASGCITALANLCSPTLQHLWDAYQQGKSTEKAQDDLSRARSVMERYAPFPPILKTMMASRFNFPRWSVRPPLLNLSPETARRAIAEMEAVL
jgi:4-hydroxy-tetrahydrodipicolinate synthase